MKKLFLSLILILLVSGCAGLPFDIPFFSSQGPKVKELPPDVISIHNISVLPSSSVREKDQFSVYFEVLNQDEFKEIDLSYNVYDTGLCKPLEGDPPISPGSTSDDYDDSFAPKETRLVEWTFKAPSADEIAQISVACPIRFKFDFSYQAKSQIDVIVINRDHLSELQRSGKATTFTPTVNVGRGPIKIYFDFGTSLPVKENYTLPVYLMVEDKGTGLLREIKSGTFEITFPDGFVVPGDACPYFGCSGNVCTNNDNIPIINKKSLEIRCSNIKTPSPVNLERTYFISATIDYDYAAIGKVNVEVKP